MSETVAMFDWSAGDQLTGMKCPAAPDPFQFHSSVVHQMVEPFQRLLRRKLIFHAKRGGFYGVRNVTSSEIESSLMYEHYSSNERDIYSLENSD